MRRPEGSRAITLAVLGRPRLWPVAVTTAVRFAPSRWWRRWPPSPWPDEDYWRFRMETAYGGTGEGLPAPEDVVEFLEWCRHRWHRRTRALR